MPSIEMISAPPPPRFFVGRKDLIDNIVAEITASSVTPVIALQGMGGIGKTALAKQLAENVKESFPGGIFWGNELPTKDSNPSIILKNWGRLCGQNLEKESEENLPSIVHSLLMARQVQAGAILVIVDDMRLDWLGEGVKSIEQALPIDVPLIITTRQAQVAQEINAKIYNLDVLSRTESCQLLASISGGGFTETNAKKIAELCGNMPLALELMAKLAKTRKSDWLLGRLASEVDRLGVLKLDDASRKEQSVKISLEISYRALAEQHPETALVFRSLAAFARPAFIIFKHLVNSLAQPKSHKPPNQNLEKVTTLEIDGSILQSQQQTINDDEDAVFVSYAWGGESEQIVDELEQAFAKRSIRIIRDKKELGYKGSIKEFEERIGRGHCVVLVISDKYLRSEHCMYELVEVKENSRLRERIFPIVLTDARIYKAIDRLTYIKHWDGQINQLNEALKQVSVMTNLTNITADLDTYARIRANFDHLTDLLSDMNVLTPEMHAQGGFSSIISAIERTIPGRPPISQAAQVAAQTSHNKLEESESPEQSIKSVEDHLLRLVDWSLLIEDEDIIDGEMDYFHMHTLLHEYVQSILIDADEIEDAIRNHVLYCVFFAEANPVIDLQKHQRSTLEFEKSYGQLLQALAKLKERYLVNVENWNNHLELAHQVILLIDALDNHWQLHSQFAEQVEWLQVAYLCAGALGNTIKQADFARRVGRALGWRGELDEALDWMNRSKETLGDDERDGANAIQALIYIHRASIQYLKDSLDMAEDDCMRGLAIVNEVSQPKIYAEGYNILGAIKIKNGNLASGLEAFEKSLLIWKQVGDKYQIYRVEDNIRTTLFYIGNIAHLRKAEDKSLQYWEQFPNRIELAMALTNRGLVHSLDGEYVAAIKLQKRAIEISDLLGAPRIQAMTRTNIAGPYISLEKYDEAERYLNKSLEIQMEYEIKEYWTDTKRSLAEVALGRKSGSQAIELAMEAEKLAREGEEPLEVGAALRVLGQTHHLIGNLEQALKCLEASLALMRENGFKYESYLSLLAIGRIHKDLGDTEKLLKVFEESQALSKEMGLTLPNAISNQT